MEDICIQNMDVTRLNTSTQDKNVSNWETNSAVTESWQTETN